MEHIETLNEDDTQMVLALVQFEMDCHQAKIQHQAGNFTPSPASTRGHWDENPNPEWSHLGF